MRPTELKFRSPKEKTAEFILPVVNNQGNMLFEVASAIKKPSFSKSRRFGFYEEQAKTTGYRVGPGSYHQNYNSVGTAHIKGGHKYKKYHGEKDTSNNGYLFIGNHLMFDSSFLLQSKKNTNQEVNHRVDATLMTKINNATRISTASNTPSKQKKDFKYHNIMSPQYFDTSKSRVSR
jgi:hypothetical protein